MIRMRSTVISINRLYWSQMSSWSLQITSMLNPKMRSIVKLPMEVTKSSRLSTGCMTRISWKVSTSRFVALEEQSITQLGFCLGINLSCPKVQSPTSEVNQQTRNGVVRTSSNDDSGTSDDNSASLNDKQQQQLNQQIVSRILLAFIDKIETF